MNAGARDIEYAANHVRTANHSTVRGALDGPETCVVVGNLVELVQRLPQVLDFLARGLRRADPAEHYDDRLTEVGPTLTIAEADLFDARCQVDGLADHLRRAHAHLGHVGRVLTEED